MAAKNHKTNILFPVEILNRELDARLFLAAHCVNENNRVFIGQFHAIRRLAGAMNGGLYVGQNIFSQPFWDTSFERYKFLKSRNFSIIHVDEEGGVYEGNEERWQWRLKRRLDPTKLDAADHICTWGNFQRDFYRSLHPACENNIVTTGNPRFDVYKKPYREYYREEAGKLRERFGDFILVNTSWPMVNNARGNKETFSLRRGYDVSDDAKRLDHINRWTHQSQVLARYVQLVSFLSAEFPETNFVIRPHPAEDISYYQTIFRGVENVAVVHEGHVAPWLFACRALIQDGCTTGIEAYFADVPIINFKALENERYDLIVPDSLGPKYFDAGEVAVRVGQILSSTSSENTPSPDIEPTSIAAAMIDNFQHNALIELSKIITTVSSRIPDAESPFVVAQFTRNLRWKRTYQHLKEKVRANAGRKTYGKISEFDGIVSELLDGKIACIQDILNKKLTYSIHTDELISLEQDRF